MNISFVRAEELEEGDWILRQVSDYAFQHQRITKIVYDEKESRVLIHFHDDGYSINASSKHIFQKVV